MTIKITGTNSVTAPGITGDDTDTGLVYGTNQVDISTGGSSRVTVNSSGNVGIGTTSPADKFHVVAGSQRNFVVRSTGGEPLLYAQNDSGNVENLTIGGNNVIFKAGSGSTGSEVARISENGGITFNGDTAAANGLDDYEEGEFTPAFRIEGQSSNISTSTEEGKYTKIGNMCTVWFYIVIDENPSGTGTAQAWEFHNLPFTSASDTAHHSIGSCRPNQINSGDYGEDVMFIPRLWNSTTQGRVEAYEQGAYAIRNASTYLQSGTGAMITLTYPCQ